MVGRKKNLDKNDNSYYFAMKAESFVDFQNSQKQSSASSGGHAFESGQNN